MRSRWIATAVAMAFVIGACQAGGPAASPAGSGGPRTIFMGSGTTEAEPYMVPLLTIGRDLLAQQGITLEYVALSTDEAVEAALDQGRVDVALLSTQGLNRAVSAGLHMKMTVGLQQHNTFVMTTGTDVTDLNQLNGKKIGNQDSTSLCVAVIRAMMDNAGLADGSYQVVDLPGSSNRAAAMESGSLDAACLFRNVAQQLADRSGGRFKIFGGLYDILDPMLWEGFVMSDNFRNNNNELANAFTKAVIDTADQFYAADPATLAARKDEIAQAETLDVDALTGDFEQYQDIQLYPTDGGLSEQHYNDMVQFLIDQNLLDAGQKVDYTNAVDPSFVETATSGT
jgi:ABC-type nitrate/sulfonate/bicarbonate transport system substrate-binding protein